MRLTCPNCAAQYEVTETDIPEAGREVQCSACGETWQQHRPETATQTAVDAPRTDLSTDPDRTAGAAGAKPPAPAPDAGPGDAPATSPDAEPAPRRLDAGVAGILRAEAARERAIRAAQATGDVQSPPGQAAPAPNLPDAGEISSSLSSASSGPGRRRTTADPAATAAPATHDGFRTGFWVAVIAIGLAAALYVTAPELVALVPEAEAPIERYVAVVDDARLRLDAFVERTIAQITGAQIKGG